MSEIRLHKLLAEAGIASRRTSEKLIAAGKVYVNGQKVTKMGFKVIPEHDVVTVEGKPVKLPATKIYLLLNKPRGFVTTLKDPQGRRTIVDLLPDVPERVHPVGRLDYDTEGLLLLTNDGQFTYALTHPKHLIEKTYLALVKGVPDHADLQQLRSGIMLADGITAPAKARIVRKFKGMALIELTIHEGRNRQVRRMLEALGHPVLRLKRTKIGNLGLGKLRVGQYRYLERKEVEGLLGYGSNGATG
ncbi:pseudouridine synthase [Zhaonella formicivorans]|uniref:pseudouridine synthase n=1 Tax=Zhaonella formicivorans TaxID=2528593 RepID=UPI0010E5520D|nr:pseudouridine synthase [Zhaonella formicivorans]